MKAQTARQSTAMRAMPLVTRWVSSTRVWRLGDLGTIWPLQRGQWLPQPAPEPLARTYAPQRMTARLRKRTVQEKVAKRERDIGSIINPRAIALSQFRMSFKITRHRRAARA